MKIITCNIRTSTASDGENAWTYRKSLCGEVIRAQSPEIICFQEMKADQFADMAVFFPEYLHYAMVDTPTGQAPANCIFYLAKRFRPISAGGFWLSETPHVAGSKSWDSACIRFANWIRLHDQDVKTEFRVINTHLDHVSQTARENQSRLITEDANAYPADFPQLLTGDMNCDHTNPAIHRFRQAGWKDTYGAVHGTENPGHTFHKFCGPEHPAQTGKMDWILSRGNLRSLEAKVIDDARDGRFPSDHYFVSAVVEIAP